MILNDAMVVTLHYYSECVRF